MKSALSSPDVAKSLALLRLAVLRACELESMHLASSGLTSGGQSDLSFVFPRTATLAAVTHAAETARQRHDAQVRARGVYHLFRLPMFWEAQIHRAALETYPSSAAFATEELEALFAPLTEMGLRLTDTGGNQGAVDLGQIDLEDPGDLGRLAGTYRLALSKHQEVIPFFTLRHS